MWRGGLVMARAAYLHISHARRVKAVQRLIEILCVCEHALRNTESKNTVGEAAEAKLLLAATASVISTAGGVACTCILVTRDVSKLSSG